MPLHIFDWSKDYNSRTHCIQKVLFHQNEAETETQKSGDGAGPNNPLGTVVTCLRPTKVEGHAKFWYKL